MLVDSLEIPAPIGSRIVGRSIISIAADDAHIVACGRGSVGEIMQKLPNRRLIGAKELTNNDDSGARCQSNWMLCSRGSALGLLHERSAFTPF